MRSGALLAVVLVAAAVAVPAGAQRATGRRGVGPSTDIRVSYDVRLVGEPTAFLVTATIELPDNVEQFEFRPPAGAEVERGTDQTDPTTETTSGQRGDATGTGADPTATAFSTATGTRTDGAATPVALGPVLAAALLVGASLRLGSRR